MKMNLHLSVIQGQEDKSWRFLQILELTWLYAFNISIERDDFLFLHKKKIREFEYFFRKQTK